MLDLQAGFFKNKNILITGHTGFKGAWLAKTLHLAGADVTGFALEPATSPSLFSLLGLQENIRHVAGDIREPGSIRTVIDQVQPEIVIHMAAQAIVKTAYEDPASTYATNVMGSVNLLDAVRENATIRSLVFITSDKCYENVEWPWGYREEDRLGGRDPYSASKACAELVFSSYFRSYLKDRSDLDAATARAGNVIGGGDWAEGRIIPDCIRAIEKQEPIILRNPLATRPWQHVLEPLSGYLLLAQKLYEEPGMWSGSWNFGPDTRTVINVEGVAKSIVSHLGRGEIKIDADTGQFHEATLLQLNCDKAHQLLRWHPRWDAAETLEQTALWYRDYLDDKDIINITEQQIVQYFGE